MAESVWLWSKTAANNATADGGIVWSELQLPSTVNNSARGMMAAVAKMRDDMGGQLTLGGGTTAYTLTTNQVLATLADGVRVVAVVNSTNTAASTLNVDSLGAKAIRKIVAAGETAIAAGDLTAAQHAVFQYDASANSAAGAWILLNPATPPTHLRVSTATARTMTAADAGITLESDEDTGAANLTHTLPAASAVAAGTPIRVRKKGRDYFTIIAAAGSDRIGDDGPRFTISGAAAAPTTNLIRLTIPSDGNRQMDHGTTVFVEGVTGVTAANGLHTCDRDNITGTSTIDLAGTTFSGTYSAGTDYITIIATSIKLRVQGEWVQLESNGVDRWDIVGEGSGRHSITRDFLLGPVHDYTGGQVNIGALGISLGFWYNAAYRRIGSSTVYAIDFGDTPEFGAQRAEITTGTADTPSQVLSGTGVGIYHGTGYGSGGWNGRSAQFMVRVTEDGSSGAGGRAVINTTTTGTAGTRVDRFNVQEQTSVGTISTVGLFNIAEPTNRPSLHIRATATDLTSDILRVRGPATSTYTGGGYDLAEFQSNDGSDVECRITYQGNVQIDGAVSSPAADIAERSLPWWDGNPKKEDRRGMTVVQVRAGDPDVVIWPGDRGHRKSFIRLYDTMPKGTPPEAIWAPISSNPMAIGGDYALHWKGKFQCDRFGTPEWEEADRISWKVYDLRNSARSGEPPAMGYGITDEVALWSDRASAEELASIPPDHSQTLEEALEELKQAGIKGDKRGWGDRGNRWISSPVRQKAWRKKWSAAFDPTRPHVPRAERAEWFHAALAKVGDVWVRVDQTLHPLWPILEETDELVLVSVSDQRRRS